MYASATVAERDAPYLQCRYTQPPPPRGLGTAVASAGWPRLSVTGRLPPLLPWPRGWPRLAAFDRLGSVQAPSFPAGWLRGKGWPSFERAVSEMVKQVGVYTHRLLNEFRLR